MLTKTCYQLGMFYALLLTLVCYPYATAASSNTTVKPTTELIAKDCSALQSSSCENCTAYANCIWCFSDSYCADHSLLDVRGKCEEDDWYRGDCDKPAKEEVLLYVLLACALFLLIIVVLLVIYIFCWKLPRENRYAPLGSDSQKKHRKRSPLMSKKFKPVGSRTDALKKKYALDDDDE